VILLDTHAWVRWLHPEISGNLPEPLRQWLGSAEDSFAVSVISTLEVAQLVKKGTLKLPLPLPDWFDLALERADIECLSVTPRLLHASTVLPDIHKDPADRIIIATAQARGALLVTADETIQTYPNLITVWANPPHRPGPVEGEAT
jgi:PIN domain nuclease of toxin-antitoxin system